MLQRLLNWRLRGSDQRILDENQCMNAGTSWGRTFWEIFLFSYGVYWSRAIPGAHYTEDVNLPNNFQPSKWRVVFDVFVPRFYGYLWVGTEQLGPTPNKVRNGIHPLDFSVFIPMQPWLQGPSPIFSSGKSLLVPCSLEVKS